MACHSLGPHPCRSARHLLFHEAASCPPSSPFPGHRQPAAACQYPRCSAVRRPRETRSLLPSTDPRRPRQPRAHPTVSPCTLPRECIQVRPPTIPPIADLRLPSVIAHMIPEILAPARGLRLPVLTRHPMCRDMVLRRPIRCGDHHSRPPNKQENNLAWAAPPCRRDRTANQRPFPTRPLVPWRWGGPRPTRCTPTGKR